MSNNFIHQLTVYSDDTDCYGIVYHANYLRFMDHARTEWLQLHSHYNLEQLRQQDYLLIEHKKINIRKIAKNRAEEIKFGRWLRKT